MLLGFVDDTSERANWRMNGRAELPAGGERRSNGAMATLLAICSTQVTRSITCWIARAPGTAVTTGGWSRSGRFSLKCGPVTGMPSMLVRPFSLISDGVRAARAAAKAGRAGGDRRRFSASVPAPAENAAARIAGS